MTDSSNEKPADAEATAGGLEKDQADDADLIQSTSREPPRQAWVTHRVLMVLRLPAILGCDADELPRVFLAPHSPKILKRGIHEDLLAQFPRADQPKLTQWLKWWTKSPHYCRKIIRGRYRHDLAGNDVAALGADDVRHALGLLGMKPAPAAVPNLQPKREKAAARGRPVLSLKTPIALVMPTDGVKRRINRAMPEAKDTFKKKIQANRQIDRIVAEQTEASYIERIKARARR